MHLCDRELVDFLHGNPIIIDGPDSDQLTIITGNDIPMLNEKCLTIDGFNVCWESVAKPYEFIDQKCNMVDERIWCFDHIINKYRDPE